MYMYYMYIIYIIYIICTCTCMNNNFLNYLKFKIMARTGLGSMASASLASHGPLRPTRRPGASQAASTWPRSLSPFSPTHRASPKGLPGLWANEACAKALSPRGGAALMLPPTTKRGPPAPLKLAPPTPPPSPRTQTRNRAHSRPLAGWKGSAEPAVSTRTTGRQPPQ